MSAEYLYDAFISYRHRGADEKFALNLHQKLESQGFKVVLDQRDFQPNATVSEEMDRWLEQSRYVLAVVSRRRTTSSQGAKYS